MNGKLLDKIQGPRDLDQLSRADLEELAQEIREFLVDSISKTGGHLASNLGVVELTLAIHKVFESPKDKIVWDVGHQSYVHKILTGRKDRFDMLRKENGLSGFPKSKESVHDAFIGGHSSTSISSGYGIQKALELQGKDNHVVAVIGDGSYTGGMVYEAMNNAGRQCNNLIVILNHNDMSISKNVGAFAKYLTTMRTKPGYVGFKRKLKRVLDKTPLVGKRIKRSLRLSKIKLKHILYHDTWFEEMGFEYIGPVDGHDLKQLMLALKLAKRKVGPVLIHVDTVKGKGYSYAEENPGAYHGISKFDIETGNPDIAPEDSFSSIFGKALARFADEDESVCAVTAAMKYGTGLQHFSSKHRDRFFDVGIAEQHAVTFCAGLASQGMKPVFAVYSSFLQRAYDQIIHDCALEGQHVVFGIDRAGVVGDDGETHQGVFDVSFLSTIPGVAIYSPETYRELETCLERALYDETGLTAVRYPRGSEQIQCGLAARGKEDFLYQDNGGKKLMISYGRLAGAMIQAAESLEQVSVMKLIKIAPLPEQAVETARSYEEIYFFEEGMKNGGVGQRLMALLYESGYRGRFVLKAIDDEFVTQGTIPNTLKRYGLDAGSMKALVEDENTSE